jgi:hypothetical protein
LAASSGVSSRASHTLAKVCTGSSLIMLSS